VNAQPLLRAEDAVQAVRPGDRVYVEGGAAHPHRLGAALLERARQVGPLEVVTSVMGRAPRYCEPDAAGLIEVRSFRGSPQTRDAFLRGQLDVVSAGLSRIPALLTGALRPDVALVQVSAPDREGWCSLGVSVLYHRAAVDAARTVIAEINPAMPHTCGDGNVHVSEIDGFVGTDFPLEEFPSRPPSEQERAAARHTAEFIEDGATVQIGMGGFADAVLAELRSRRQLRIHAGLLSDGLIGLLESGAVEDAPGAVVTGAVAGTERTYGALDQNPVVQIRRVEYTHDARVLAGLTGLVAVNSAIEVDMTGQVNGESIRGVPVSGAGGALDFAHAASSAPDGLSVISLASTTRSGGHRRIVPELSAAVVVSVPRTEVDVLVTEHGAADLRGLGNRERARAVASISGAPRSEREGARS
jgi:4-hydroxybutyrate CoA-transferase